MGERADTAYTARWRAMCNQHRDRARRWRDTHYDPERNPLSRALMLDSRPPPQGADNAATLDKLAAEQIEITAEICTTVHKETR